MAQADSRQAYQGMVDFMNMVTNPHLLDLLDVALNGRGALHHLKDVLLDYPVEREHWFAFSVGAGANRLTSG